MTNEILSVIVEQMQPVLDSANFVQCEDGSFKNESITLKITHNEEKKMLILSVFEMSESGEAGEEKVLSSWLFEEPENKRDAQSAGMDFCDTLKTRLGVKRVRTERSGEVALPSKKAGDAKNVEALCGKLLSVFPQFKEDYKEHVATHGTLLYIDFFKSTFAVAIGEALDQGGKKSNKKLFDMLSDSYDLGDRTSQNAIVGVLLGAAARGNDKRYEAVLSNLEDHQFLKTAFLNIMPKVNKDKRFKEILG